MFLQNKFHRNVDRDCSWIFPLLADKDAKIKVQIFVLRKDTADIPGMNCKQGLENKLASSKLR